MLPGTLAEFASSILYVLLTRRWYDLVEPLNTNKQAAPAAGEPMDYRAATDESTFAEGSFTRCCSVALTFTSVRQLAC